MLFYKRALVGCMLVIWSASAACAFTFSYGDLFSVKNVTKQNGVLTLPKTNKKYRNVKISSKAVFDFLKNCETDCRYSVADVRFVSRDYRKARTREGMLIADVEFNDEIILTCLVFANKKGFSVKLPQEIVFNDKDLERRVKHYVEALAQENL